MNFNFINKLLFIGVLIQLGILGFIFWPQSSIEAKLLFADVEQSNFYKVIISGPQGGTVELALENGSCVLPGEGYYICEKDKLGKLLNKIVNVKSKEPVTKKSSSHNLLKVSKTNYDRIIEFSTYDTKSYRFYLGTSSNMQTTHIRIEGDDEVYMISSLSIADVPSSSTFWIDNEYLEIPRSEVVKFSIENSKGSLIFEKRDEEWYLQGLQDKEKLDMSIFESLLTRAASISIRDPLGKIPLEDYGFENPLATYFLQTQDGEGNVKKYTMLIGAQYEDAFYFKGSQSDHYIRVEGFEVESLLDIDRKSLIRPPNSQQ